MVVKKEMVLGILSKGDLGRKVILKRKKSKKSHGEGRHDSKCGSRHP